LDYDAHIAHVYSFKSGEISEMLNNCGFQLIHSEINPSIERIIGIKSTK
jgi:hypothetical protein